MSENTKIGEFSKSQNYTETNNNLNSDSKIKIEDIKRIEGTIFNIANNPDTGWFLSIGRSIITDPFPTREEAIAQLELDKWNIIMKMIILVLDKTLKIARETKEKP